MASKTRNNNQMSPAKMALTAAIVLFSLAIIYQALFAEGPARAAVPEPEVVITGEPLPPAPGQDQTAESDAAIGTKLPTIETDTFDGQAARTIDPDDGRPKLIGLMAHHCPFCQEEIAEMGPWLQDRGIDPNHEGVATVDGVDIHLISTQHAPGRPGWPTTRLTENAGLGGELLTDDPDDTIARTLGLVGTPYWVLVDADGMIAGRVSAKVGTDVLDQWIDVLASSVADADDLDADDLELDELDGGSTPADD